MDLRQVNRLGCNRVCFGAITLHSRLFHAYITRLNSSVMLFHRRGYHPRGLHGPVFLFLVYHGQCIPLSGDRLCRDNVILVP